MIAAGSVALSIEPNSKLVAQLQPFVQYKNNSTVLSNELSYVVSAASMIGGTCIVFRADICGKRARSSAYHAAFISKPTLLQAIVTALHTRNTYGT
jgi:hypothetical protein